MIIETKNFKVTVAPDDIDEGAVGMIKSFGNSEASVNCRLAVMPDGHAGKGCCIGTALQLGDRVCPGLIGNDIGCGVYVRKTKLKRPDYCSLDKIVKEEANSINKEPDYASDIIKDLSCIKYVNVKRVAESMGTLGGGNHFISVENDDEGYNYILIHSGSRILGTFVEKYWHDYAYEKTKDRVPYEYAYLMGKDMENYIRDAEITAKFAALSREMLAGKILRNIKEEKDHEVHNIPHNYISGNMLRKGAISAGEGEFVIIPLNMKDGSIIGRGLGKADWLTSAPHGAGRKYERCEVKNMYTVSQFKKDMTGIYSSTVSASTIDESPFAYKNPDLILEKIKDNVSVEKVIKPVYNFKNGSRD